jgi:integrase
MANRTVTLVRICKTEKGWRRYPVAFGKNGRVRPGWVLVGDEPEYYEQGRYELRLYEGSRLVYIPAGDNPAEALAARGRMEHKLAAKESARAAGMLLPAEDPGRVNLLAKAREFVRDAEQRGARVAADVNRLVTTEFLRIVKKSYADEISREDVFDFHAALRKRGCSDRTVANKHDRITSFLRFAGVDRSILPPSPRYDETLPTIYTSDEISSIVGAADPYMHLVTGLALKCGLRDQEIMHLEWPDIHRRDRVLRVSSKSRYGFRVKDSEERDVPVPDDLLEELEKWHKSHPESALVAGTRRGNPNTKLLRTLKHLAKRARLNCGHCEGCKAKARECQHWTLHKFRRTYCTTLLRSGVDLRTVQAYMGHADISSTMRYLRPASSKEAQAKINAIRW